MKGKVKLYLDIVRFNAIYALFYNADSSSAIVEEKLNDLCECLGNEYIRELAVSFETIQKHVSKLKAENKSLKYEMDIRRPNLRHAFFVYYENADLVYDVMRMRQLSKQTLHELSPNDNS